MVRAVVFDLDGTLVDTERLIFEATRYAIRRNIAGSISDDFLWTLFGRPVTEVWPALSPAHVEELDADFRAFYTRHRAELVQPLPGVREVLDRLSELGIGIAILSNKRRIQGEEEIAAAGIGSYFSVTLFNDDLSSPKPDPYGLRLALDRLGAEPAAALMVGDGHMDILCAKNAGVPVAAAIWAGWARRQRANLLALSPEYVLEDIRDLLLLLPPE